MRRRLAALAVLLVACHGAGEQGDRADGEAGDAGAQTVDAAASSVTVGACLDGLATASRVQARRLSGFEYDNSVRDLFGVTSRPGARFLPEPPRRAATPSESGDAPTEAHVWQYLLAAEQVAREAMPYVEGLVAERCAELSADDCLATVIGALGRRVWRRPLVGDERARLIAVGASFADADPAARLEPVLAVMLQAPQFLYRLELGSGSAAAESSVRLSDHEIATRLSFFLWASTPDDALLDAADRGALHTAEQIAAEAERMLADSRARAAVEELHRAWLGYDRVVGVAKDPVRHPEFTSTLAETLASDTRRFIEDVVFDTSDGTLARLLAGDAFSASGIGAGVLTQPSLLAALAHPTQSSPIRRGYFVRERILCQPLPPPPPDVRFEVAEPGTDGTTTRERFSVVRESPLCANCHERIDPVGHAFEHYDETGAWRDDEAGHAIDARAHLTGTDVDGDYDGAAELVRALAESETVRDCYVSQWLSSALGWAEGEGDVCTIDAVHDAFALGGHGILDLAVAVTRTEAFRHAPALTQEATCP